MPTEKYSGEHVSMILDRRLEEKRKKFPAMSENRAFSDTVKDVMLEIKNELAKLHEAPFLSLENRNVVQLKELLEYIVDKIGVTREDLDRNTKSEVVSRGDMMDATPQEVSASQKKIEAYDNTNPRLVELATDLAHMRHRVIDTLDGFLADSDLFAGDEVLFGKLQPGVASEIPSAEYLRADIQIMLEAIEVSTEMVASLERHRTLDVRRERALRRRSDKKKLLGRWQDQTGFLKVEKFWDNTWRGAVHVTGRSLIELWYQMRRVRENVTAKKKLK